ncbi:MAG: hypothetical protein QQN41_07790 [Nitrosopumilus sp.]
MKKALILGAGSAGKGVLGLELHKAGYELTFAAVTLSILQEINENRGYTVEIVDNGEKIFVPVHEVVHMNDKDELDRIVQDTSVIFTAIGPNNLEYAARIIGEPLYKKAKKGNLLNIVACENILNNSSNLKNLIGSQIGQEKAKIIDANVGFPNCMVDRISVFEDGIVRVEDYYEWIIESKLWKGESDIPAVRYIPEIEPFATRKLYMLNGAHVTIGFAGQTKGIIYVHGALDDQKIESIVRGQLEEANYGVSHEYGFSEQEQQVYIEQISQRFKNEKLRDKTIRLTRGQIRKLKRHERLIGPALLVLKHGEEPVNTAHGISYLFRHFDSNDHESRMVHNYLEQNGLQRTLNRYCGLNRQNPLDARLIGLIERSVGQSPK